MKGRLYRAKCIGGLKNKGEWVIGVHVVHPNGDQDCIYKDGYFHHILPDTLGQSTGIFDSYGIEIFEGDILRKDKFNGKDPMSYSIFIGVVEFSRCTFRLVNTPKIDMTFESMMSITISNDSFDILSCSKVIGNFYDTPELLKTDTKTRYLPVKIDEKGMVC